MVFTATTPVHAAILWIRGREMVKNAGKDATTLVYDGILRSRGREMPKNAGNMSTTPV